MILVNPSPTAWCGARPNAYFKTDAAGKLLTQLRDPVQSAHAQKWTRGNVFNGTTAQVSQASTRSCKLASDIVSR